MEEKLSFDVLVVDDQPGIRRLIEVLVKESGNRVHLAQNGVEAIERVCQKRPQLVFMDVSMPVMGGLEALAKIKLISPETEVVVMTAYITDEVIEKAWQLGALCSISKPFEIEWMKGFLKEFASRLEKKDVCLADTGTG